MRWKFPAAIVLVAGSAAVIGLVPGARTRAANVWKTLRPAPRPTATAPRPAPPEATWDGRLEVTRSQQGSLGVEVVDVVPQTVPIRMEVNGTTAYDPSTITQIRTRFSSLVKKVHVSLGDTVTRGQPLVELYSVELAEAKSIFEERLTQWTHDAKQLERHKLLYDQKAISEQVYLDTVNDEQKSRLEYKLARDKLSVYGLQDAEIEGVKNESGAQKATMILRSPTDGIVIARDVVQDNLYDISTVLMAIAPLDHLWVKGNVYESDQHRVVRGQRWEIRFPYITERVIEAKVEHIDARVDPVTKTVQIRTSIPNPQGQLKADMLVRGTVLIPPCEGRTVIPRNAVVVADGDSYVFVRENKTSDRFVRRQIEVAKEYHDQVIVHGGLVAGEQVAARGSLILAQMYEDRSVSNSGNPL